MQRVIETNTKALYNAIPFKYIASISKVVALYILDVKKIKASFELQAIYLCHKAIQQKNSSKPCHCNYYFRKLALLLLYLSKLFKRELCRCRKTKTGLAPPQSSC